MRFISNFLLIVNLSIVSVGAIGTGFLSLLASASEIALGQNPSSLMLMFHTALG